MKLRTAKEYRGRRHKRLRRKIIGTASCPRMAMFVSNKHLYVQLIDDDAGNTLAAASTLNVDGAKGSLSVASAKLVGKVAADKAREKGIERVVFDRGGFTYGGRAKALADAAREAGLKF